MNRDGKREGFGPTRPGGRSDLQLVGSAPPHRQIMPRELAFRPDSHTVYLPTLECCWEPT